MEAPTTEKPDPSAPSPPNRARSPLRSRSGGPCAGCSSGRRATSRIPGRTTTSRSSRCSPGWGSAPTASPRPPTVPTRRSAPSGDHSYLAVALALATAVTVLVISIAYSQIIKRFPFGGGGYVVATELLGPGVGVVSGSALLVDYVLTISVSIASGGDAIFSFLPPGAAPWKLPFEAVGDRRSSSSSTCAA